MQTDHNLLFNESSAPTLRGRLVLTTYDSIVTFVPNYYMQTGQAIDFAGSLTSLATAFAELIGMPKEQISWMEVEDSDWCKRMIVVYCKVPADWQPVQHCSVWDESYDQNWFPNHVRSAWDFIAGQGRGQNHEKNPPAQPHSLYRTKLHTI